MPPPEAADLIKQRLKSLPDKPGCYLYKGPKGEVLYVGKAISLKNRVRSYFHKSANHGSRIARLVHRLCDIEWIVVESELEALVLECSLIKQHRPPFNVRMRDDKSYPYIVITKESFPRVLFSRNPKRGFGKAYGPYTSSFQVRETLQLLHKTFPLIPCGKSWTGAREQRPCLYHHIGQCLAPCAGMADKEAYAGVIDQVARFLNGKEEGVIQQIEGEMEQAAEALEFEKAATLRDRAAALRSVQQKQKVVSEDVEDKDVISVVKDDRGAAIQMLYIRAGRLVGQKSYMLDGAGETSPSEAVQEFVKQYYSTAPELPREILLPVEIEERRIVESWLRQRKGSAVDIEVPQGGQGMKLLDMAAENAEEALKTFALELEQKESLGEKGVEELSDALGLTIPAQRVEGYDISNIQGTAPVGSMVVSLGGNPTPAEYRRFRIKWNPESPNDFAMMHELITRRLRRHLDGDPKFVTLPELIMIDGGKGQLHAALKARDALGLTVPMVGLAKKQEIIYLPDGRDEKGEYTWTEVVLPLQSPGLLLLTRLRDEAHRFAITYHRKIRDKRVQGSVLDEIPGIGPKKRRLLLRTFGSVEAIRRAKVEEIASVPTLTRKLAEQIHEYLQVE